jgi:DNA-directed RNA polymerase subunit RPC12/RpoP
MRRFRIRIPFKFNQGSIAGGILHSEFITRLGEGWTEINGFDSKTDYTFSGGLISTPDETVLDDVQDVFPEASVTEIPDEIDTSYLRDMTCPYCGWKVGDAWELESDDGDYECGDCGETFFYERNIEITYCTRKKETS